MYLNVVTIIRVLKSKRRNDKCNYCTLRWDLRFIIVTCLTVIVNLTGQEVEVKRLSIRGLMPDTDYYMTYDGSTTMPACHETVTWIVINKPIYITKQQVSQAINT